MIAGATYTLPISIDIDIRKSNKIIITLKNWGTGKTVQKRYPNDSETRLMDGGMIGAKLSQQDTIDLCGNVAVEAQINLASGAVAKTHTVRTFIAQTLYTEIVEGAEDMGDMKLNGVSLQIGTPITEVETGMTTDPDVLFLPVRKE
jgi:hypothetical protein